MVQQVVLEFMEYLGACVVWWIVRYMGLDNIRATGASNKAHLGGMSVRSDGCGIDGRDWNRCNRCKQEHLGVSVVR